MKNDIYIDSFEKGIITKTLFNSSEYINRSNYAYNIQNMMVLPNGSLIRRPGTFFIADIISKNHYKIETLTLENNFIILIFSTGKIEYILLDNNIPCKVMLKGELTSSCIVKNSIHDLKNNQIYLLSYNCIPQVLSWNKLFEFSLSSIPMDDFPYNDFNQNKKLSIKIVSLSNMTFITSNVSIFKGQHKGTKIRILYNKHIYEYKIMQVVNGKKVIINGNIPSSILSKDIVNYSFLAWNDYDGYPSNGVMFKGRLYLTNTKKNQSTIWISKFEHYTDFNSIVNDSNLSKEEGELNLSVTGFIVNIYDSQYIKWIYHNHQDIIFSTENGIFILGKNQSDSIFNYNNYAVKLISSKITGNNVLFFDDFVFFTDYQERNLFAIEFLQTRVISLYDIFFSSQHLVTSKIKQIIISESPFKIFWVLLEDNTLMAATVFYNARNSITEFAWHKHLIGGKDTKVQFISASNWTKGQNIWMLLSRKVNKQNSSSIEQLFLSPSFNLKEEESNYYIDSQKKVFINNQESMDYLLDDSIYVVSNNKSRIFSKKDIQDKNILIKNFNESVWVGFSYFSIYKSKFLHGANVEGAFNKSKIDAINIKSFNSGRYYLEAYNSLYEVNKESKDYNKVLLSQNYSYSNQVIIMQNKPYFLHLGSIYVSITTQ